MNASNPFPGLRPFDIADASVFFGRNRHIEDLLKRLGQQRFLGVVGTSGAGKSSLVRAGLLPALYDGFLTGGVSEWHVAVMRPGDDPIDALAAALAAPEVFGASPLIAETLASSSQGLTEAVLRAGLQPGENLLIVVDQFEELFRYPKKQIERAAAFVQRLLNAAATDRAGIYVILTMRSDYLGECAQFEGLAERLNGGQYLIPRLSIDEREEAITGPVLVGGGTITPALVKQLLNDSGAEPDQLPVLQHTLSRLWEIWQDEGRKGPIDLRHYRDKRIGNMSQALDRHASSVFAELKDPDQQRIARLLFRRISDRTPGKRDTRRPTRVKEIMDVSSGPLETIQVVFDHFSQPGVSFLQASPLGRLKEDSILDISHEALIANWSTLRGWANRESDYARDYLRLTEATRAKEKLTMRTVRSYFQWQVRLLGDLVLESASGLPARWILIEMFSVPHVLMPRAFGRMQRAITARGEMGRQALVPPQLIFVNGLVDPDSGPLPVWASRYTPDPETYRNAMLHLYRQYRGVLIWLSIYYLLALGLVVVLALFLAERNTSNVQAISLQAQELVSRANASVSSDVAAALASAVTSIETTQRAKMEPVVGATDVLKRATLAAPSLIFQGHKGAVKGVAWSPDGKKLASVSDDGRIGIWSIETGQLLAMSPWQKTALTGLDWKPDGSTLLVSGLNGMMQLWTPDPLAFSSSLPRMPGGWAVVSWNRPGTELAAGGYDGRMKTLSNDGVSNSMGVTRAPIRSLAWRPNSSILAAGYQNDEVEIWDADEARHLGTVPSPAPPWAVAWNDSGQLLATGAQDWTARLFEIDLDSGPFRYRQAGPGLGHKGWVTSLAWGHKTTKVDRSSTLATGSLTVKLFSISPSGADNQLAELGQYNGDVYALAWSPDQQYLAAGTTDTKIYVYRLDVLDANSTDSWMNAARSRLRGLRHTPGNSR